MKNKTMGLEFVALDTFEIFGLGVVLLLKLVLDRSAVALKLRLLSYMKFREQNNGSRIFFVCYLWPFFVFKLVWTNVDDVCIEV